MNIDIQKNDACAILFFCSRVKLVFLPAVFFGLKKTDLLFLIEKKTTPGVRCGVFFASCEIPLESATQKTKTLTQKQTWEGPCKKR